MVPVASTGLVLWIVGGVVLLLLVILFILQLPELRRYIKMESM